jgi:hypothetical protein
MHWDMYPTRGWLLARAETHAVLYLTTRGTWSDEPGDARLFDSRAVAAQAARRHQDASVLEQSMLDWLLPPRIRVSRRPMLRR